MPNTPFSMRIDPDLKARLDLAAQSDERPASYIATKAIEEYLDARDAKNQAIAQALAEAEKGEFISEAAMSAWIDSWDTDLEIEAPVPDIKASAA